MGGDRTKLNDKSYDSTPEVYKALFFTLYTGRTMKIDKDILMMKNIIRELGYTSVGDKPSGRKTFLTETLPKLVEEIQNKTFGDIIDSSNNDLQGQGNKITIPSKLFDIYTRLEILLGLNLSSHTDTLRHASILIDEIY